MVGVIILNYNNAKLTQDCIESVRRVNTAPVKFIVVDNASADESVRNLQSFFSSFENKEFWSIPTTKQSLPEFSFVISPINGGYAQGNNLGLRLADLDDDIEIVMVLNNDVLFIKDIIPGIVHFISTHHNAGLVSPLLLTKDCQQIDHNCARRDVSLKEVFLYYLFYCRDWHGILSAMSEKRKILPSYPNLKNCTSIQIELPSGSCMAINKNLFKSIGFFDPNTFLYYEENILFRKLRRAGFDNFLLPQEQCVHLGARTTSKSKRDYSYLRTCNKSAYYYVMNYRDLSAITRFVFTAVYRLYSLTLFVKQKCNELFKRSKCKS